MPRAIHDYLDIIGENHGDVVLIHVALLLHGEFALRPPASDRIQVDERVEEDAGLRVQEAGAALAVGCARAQRLEFR